MQMSDRYFGKIIKVLNPFTAVINVGIEQEVKVGSKFLIVGLGDEVVDPDTNETLGVLEIVRGNARVSHVQERMATITCSDTVKPVNKTEIKKVTNPNRNGLGMIFGAQDMITESTIAGEPEAKPFSGIQAGDRIIEA
jgi:hypothetical protein